MPIDQKINYLELPARDLDAVRRFYEGAFGWTFTDYGPEYWAFPGSFLLNRLGLISKSALFDQDFFSAQFNQDTR